MRKSNCDGESTLVLKPMCKVIPSPKRYQWLQKMGKCFRLRMLTCAELRGMHTRVSSINLINLDSSSNCLFYHRGIGEGTPFQELIYLKVIHFPHGCIQIVTAANNHTLWKLETSCWTEVKAELRLQILKSFFDNKNIFKFQYSLNH